MTRPRPLGSCKGLEETRGTKQATTDQRRSRERFFGKKRKKKRKGERRKKKEEGKKKVSECRNHLDPACMPQRQQKQEQRRLSNV